MVCRWTEDEIKQLVRYTEEEQVIISGKEVNKVFPRLDMMIVEGLKRVWAEVGKCLTGWKFNVPREIGEGAERQACLQRLPDSGLLHCESPPFSDTKVGKLTLKWAN